MAPPPTDVETSDLATSTEPAALRKRRALYRLVSFLLVAVMALAVADLFLPVLGVDSTTTRVEATDGTLMVVEYPSVTRPALASPFAIELTRPDGFDGPIEIAISRPWIEVWDENGMYPAPSSETGDERWVIYEFDPPEGDRFRFFYDARLEPGRQESFRGEIELRGEDSVLARVRFQTKVRP